MNIAIVSSGYLGLAKAGSFTQVAHHVICVSKKKQVANADFGLVKELMRSPIIFDERNQTRPRTVRRNGIRLLRNRSLAPRPYCIMKLILAVLAVLSMGAYLYGEEAQTAEPAAATRQISEASPQPDIGSTVDYLTAKHGKPVKVEKAWCGGTAYGFRPTEMTYVYAIETNGVVNDVTYFDFNKPQMTQEDSVNLFRSQFPLVPAITWTDKEHKEGLGQEKGKHWTHTQWIAHRKGKSFISNPKDKGWQFRTPEQFAAEQAVIKALKKKWLEQEKGKPTPRKKSGTSKASTS
jgi:hypothetical protein